MAELKTIFLTGATRGLGLALARSLDRRDDVRLVLGVRDVAAGHAIAAMLRHRPEVLRIDTGSLASVRAVSESWTRPLFAVVHNAGLQWTGPPSMSAEGVETTFAVNHLGPLALTTGLLPHLVGGCVVAVGSGTHNPQNRTATRFGFRGARYTSARALARGDVDGGDEAQRNLDRYATSKLCAMVTQMELARRHPQTTFVTFDPGLMPGTGLVRTAPWYVRVAWGSVLRWVVPFLDDASTPARSAASLGDVLLRGDAVSGEVYGLDGRPSIRVWDDARDPALGRRVVDESRDLLMSLGFGTQ